jgi:hypothetical protein
MRWARQNRHYGNIICIINIGFGTYITACVILNNLPARQDVLLERIRKNPSGVLFPF